ncbi:MAG: hypothetical protein JXB42_08260 [Deltaproteobacteria bacterium]|nr:hypothetical protein [Deltaproteobacteria bacterium]
MKLRWPKSVHAQVEAVFHSVRAIGQGKIDNPNGIRSFGTWKTYRSEAHRLADFLQNNGCDNILDTPEVARLTGKYLQERFNEAIQDGKSLQTAETRNAALGKFELAVNTFMENQGIQGQKLDLSEVRRTYSKLIHDNLDKSSRNFDNRAYPNPQNLINAITNSTHQLQAKLQYEGGCRAEGVGAPSNAHPNPLTKENLGGIGKDPVTGEDVGILKGVVEKGGKATDHMISTGTYAALKNHIEIYGRLESNYKEYSESINEAAKKTGQYEPGRGTHALKHNFAQGRYRECVASGYSHEQAIQQTSLDTSHFRYYETYAYTKK